MTRVDEHIGKPTGRAALETSSRRLVCDVLLGVGLLAGIVSILKGLSTAVDQDAEFYWLFNYGHGFIKRGLIGTIVAPIVTRASLEQVEPLIAGAHVIACLTIMLTFYRLFRSALFAAPRADSRLAIALAFICLMCSQMLGVLAHDTGSVDPYVIGLVVAGAWLILRGRYAIAVVAGIVGPFIHEAFVIAWAPLAVLLLWSCATTKDRRGLKLAAAAAPALAALVVTSAHNATAVGRLMQAWQATDAIKSGHLAFTFGQTFRTSFEHMKNYEYPGHWANVATTVAFFMVPNALLLWTAAFCYAHRWSMRETTLLVSAAAMLSPLAALALAWDLSRFLVWSTVGAAVVLLGVGSPALTAMNDRHV